MSENTGSTEGDNRPDEEADEPSLLGFAMPADYSPSIMDCEALPQAMRDIILSKGNVLSLTTLYALVDAWGETQRMAVLAASRAAPIAVTPPDPRSTSITAKMEKFFGAKGLVLSAQDKLEMAAMMEGFDSAEIRNVYYAGQKQFRVVKLHLCDFTATKDVVVAPHSLEGPLLGVTSDFDAAILIAERCAVEQQAPMLVVDATDTVRQVVDEPLRPEAEYSIQVSSSEILDGDAVTEEGLCADNELVDAGYRTKRAAFACFIRERDRCRENGEHIDSIIFINDYGVGIPGLIVHREVV